MEGSIKKVDRDNCLICSNEIEEGEPFEVYGSAINPRYAHTKCQNEDANDYQRKFNDKFIMPDGKSLLETLGDCFDPNK